jgi:hypothetical protein
MLKRRRRCAVDGLHPCSGGKLLLTETRIHAYQTNGLAVPQHIAISRLWGPWEALKVARQRRERGEWGKNRGKDGVQEAELESWLEVDGRGWVLSSLPRSSIERADQEPSHPSTPSRQRTTAETGSASLSRAYLPNVDGGIEAAGAVVDYVAGEHHHLAR